MASANDPAETAREAHVETPDPIAAFDGRTISYTYDNGWSFTNTFDGHLRRSSVPRGNLEEIVQIAEVRDGLYFLSWIDDEMGLLAQVIDVHSGAVLATVPSDDDPGTTILRGSMIERAT